MQEFIIGNVIQCQIRAFSVLAEMEGMKAENEKQKRYGESPTYGEDHFMDISKRLEALAYEAGERY